MRFYLNLKLSTKLFLTLMFIAVLGMMIGILGITATSRLSAEDQKMYQYNTLPMKYLATMYDTFASQRISAENMVIFRESDPAFSQEENDSITEKEGLFDEAFHSFSLVLSDETERQLYQNINQLYYNDFKEVKAELRAAVAAGSEHAISAAIFEIDTIGAQISDYMDAAFDLNDELAAEKVAANQALHRSTTVTLILAMIISALAATCFSFLLGRIISRPIGRVKNATQQVAETGNLSFSKEDILAIERDAQYNDETGQMANAFSAMMDALLEKTRVLETVAAGDLTAHVSLASTQDTMGNALQHTINSLNGLFVQIHGAANQVSAGSTQIADGAQVLAQGSTEQASSIEELSASIAEIAHRTKQNASIAKEAAQLSGTIRGNAEKGSVQMDQMMQAVREINDASIQIEKVIRVIEDIAFQTNILALNAAVEAARAGQHGKGFAVVADEVRSLAAKSAEAAKDTGALIENSMAKANLGLGIATETSSSMNEIVQGIKHSAEIVEQIAHLSNEQAGAITQINIGIDQVTHVVQQNSATAEQSAAASEQMSGQSNALEQLLSHFKLKDSELSCARAGVPTA